MFNPNSSFNLLAWLPWHDSRNSNIISQTYNILCCGYTSSLCTFSFPELFNWYQIYLANITRKQIMKFKTAWNKSFLRPFKVIWNWRETSITSISLMRERLYMEGHALGHVGWHVATNLPVIGQETFCSSLFTGASILGAETETVGGTPSLSQWG